MNVLIIDDSVVIRKIVEEALLQTVPEITGIFGAADGLEGIAAIEQLAAAGTGVDLILCDVHMPRLDGIGFLQQRIQSEHARSVPVLMLTADADDPYLLRAIAAGADGYIAKPFTARQIQAAVAGLLPEPTAASCPHASNPIGGAP